MKTSLDKPKADMRDKVSHYFTLALFVGFLFLLFELFSAFAGALVGAVAIGISFYPFHQWMKKKLPKLSPSFRAFISDLVVVLFIILPLFFIIWAAVEQSDSWSPLIKGWQSQLSQVRNGRILDSNETVKGAWGWINQTFSIRPSEARGQLSQSVDKLLGYTAALGGRAAAELMSSIGALGMMIFALFFIFRDGEKYYTHAESFLPLREEEKVDCRQRGRIIITGVIRGWFLGAMIQGLIALAGYGIAGIEAWIIFGVLTMMAGLLPVVGTALVWVPLSVSAFLQGHPGQGFFLLCWGFLVVGLVDNVLRPYLVGKNSDVSFFMLFISLLGGLQVWGFKGIIMGPLIVAVAPVIFDVYKKRYMHEPEVV